MEKDNLWEGISIMSPQEMENGYTNDQEKETDEETAEESGERDSDEFTITPISTDKEKLDKDDDFSIESTETNRLVVSEVKNRILFKLDC